MKRKTPNKFEDHEMPADASKRTGWLKARRTADPLTAKLPQQRITINIDRDIIAIFKAEALRGGPPYQVAINQALRTFLRDREKSSKNQAVESILIALKDPRVRRKIQNLSRSRRPRIAPV